MNEQLIPGQKKCVNEEEREREKESGCDRERVCALGQAVRKKKKQ